MHIWFGTRHYHTCISGLERDTTYHTCISSVEKHAVPSPYVYATNTPLLYKHSPNTHSPTAHSLPTHHFQDQEVVPAHSATPHAPPAVHPTDHQHPQVPQAALLLPRKLPMCLPWCMHLMPVVVIRGAMGVHKREWVCVRGNGCV